MESGEGMLLRAVLEILLLQELTVLYLFDVEVFQGHFVGAAVLDQDIFANGRVVTVRSWVEEAGRSQEEGVLHGGAAVQIGDVLLSLVVQGEIAVIFALFFVIISRFWPYHAPVERVLGATGHEGR